MDAHALSLAVRWLHVAAAATLLGGALLVWALTWRTAPGSAETLLLTAGTYEWGFWGAVGLVVMTGVGNLGAFGGALPGPETTWGARLAWKLLAGVMLLLLSLVRTLLVARLLHQRHAGLSLLPRWRHGGPHPGGGVDLRAAAGAGAGDMRLFALQASYAATALAVVAVLGLAALLAHG